MIFAGSLTETLSFYKVVESQTASGYKTRQEQLRFSVVAEKVKNKGDFIVEASQLFHSADKTFRLRYRPEIQETDIVKYKEQRYQIVDMDVVSRVEMIIKISRIDD